MGFLSKPLGLDNEFQAQGVDINRQDFAKQIADAQARSGVQQGLINSAPQDQFRNQQMSLSQALQARASGQAPSVAQMQLNAGQDRSVQQAQAMAASARGGVNPALAQRQAQMANAATQASNNQAGGMLRAQEQMGAENQLGQLASQGRQQDIGLASAQTDAGLGLQRQNDAYSNALQQAKAQEDSNRISQNNAINNVNAGVASGNQAAAGAVFSGVMNGASSAATGGLSGAVKKAHGGVIQGTAQVAGDSFKNDKVQTILSPGEIVIPRTMATDPAFLKHLAKEPTGYGKVLAAQAKARMQKGGK